MNDQLPTLTLKIILLQSNPQIWRRLEVPAGYSFFQLHLGIQAAFGWENAHLFQFGMNGLADTKGIGIPHREDEFSISDARTVSLKKIFKKAGDTLIYVYDFGDHWQHQITVETITSKVQNTAVCTGGERECPPEDVGSMHGYEQMLECFTAGTSAEKKEYLDWLGLSSNEKWDAAHFNMREIRKRMALVSPESPTF